MDKRTFLKISALAGAGAMISKVGIASGNPLSNNVNLSLSEDSNRVMHIKEATRSITVLMRLMFSCAVVA